MAIKAASQMTLVDLTDAYGVTLSSEAYTFVGDTTGAPAGLSCSTEAQAICGSNICTAVSVDAKTITCPTGISVKVDNSGTAKPKITFTTTAKITAACEATIPVTVDGITINKKFSFAVAKTGATGQTGAAGKGIKSTSITYQAGTSGTTAPTGTWEASIPAVSASQYLWTRTITTYTDNTTSTQYSVGMMGATGAKGDKGDKGATGDAAISMTITSSNGNIFKNNTGSTVLTAHVFKGAVEQTIGNNGVVAGIGTVKWYIGGVYNKSSATLEVSAGDVVNSQVYTCQIE